MATTDVFLPSSPVDIANAALALLGAQKISTFSDPSDSAVFVTNVFGTIRDTVFRAIPWRCLRTRAQLVNISQINPNPSTIPLILYPPQAWPQDTDVFAYQLPNNPYCLRALHTSAELTDDWWIESGAVADGGGYQFSQNQAQRILVTTYGTTSIQGMQVPLFLLYTGRILDVTVYDPMLVSALISRLAAELAYPITNGSKNGQVFMTMYKEKMDEASLVDGQEGAPDVLDDDDLINVRY
jgi:hypothetical protein